MPKKRKSARPAKTLVRAANGDLYVVTETKITKLNMKTTGRRVKQILRKAAGEISEVISRDVPTLASGVETQVTEIFAHD